MMGNARTAQSFDQRTNERVQVRLTGKLFVPAEDNTLDCFVHNLSGGGAGVLCPTPPPLKAFVILYVEGFGRFEGVTTRYVHGELGLRFVCKDAKRQRLERDLEAFIKDGAKGVTRLRRHPRSAALHQIDRFTRRDGTEENCQLVNVSIQGAMLITAARPPLGELIRLGQILGCVVRHDPEGIGVQFLQPAAPPRRQGQ